ncbi:hypothetical protein V8G54_035946 [Vigna mungo]|uniref:Uncharacterized protein n=1 Tax=Vigna mungo TaxID=3915 RepID=A0AAQ3RF51_VIGMU
MGEILGMVAAVIGISLFIHSLSSYHYWVFLAGNVASVSLYAAPTYVHSTTRTCFHHPHFVIMKHCLFSSLVQGYLQKGHKEEKHRRFFMHSLELSPFHLLGLASRKQQVGKFSFAHS